MAEEPLICIYCDKEITGMRYHVALASKAGAVCFQCFVIFRRQKKKDFIQEAVNKVTRRILTPKFLCDKCNSLKNDVECTFSLIGVFCLKDGRLVRKIIDVATESETSL